MLAPQSTSISGMGGPAWPFFGVIVKVGVTPPGLVRVIVTDASGQVSSGWATSANGPQKET